MKEKIICGIEEAGRGPVIGSMVICGIACGEKDIKKLRELGVKDSKALSPERREELYPKIMKIAKKCEIVKVTPKEIDMRFEVGVNLNKLEAIKMAEIINKIKPDIVYVDAPSSNPDGFKRELKKYLKIHPKIISENYADVKYPIVSAASIIAKVERDKEIKEISEEYGIDIGPGYSHDERTIKFVKELIKKGKIPDFVRKSWDTFKRLKREKEQKKLLDF